eukprot:6647502-Pyramimonas_sp.AAC.1
MRAGYAQRDRSYTVVPRLIDPLVLGGPSCQRRMLRLERTCQPSRRRCEQQGRILGRGWSSLQTVM